MGEIATIGIYDDLSSGQTGVTVRTTDNKVSSGVNMNVCNFVDIEAVFFQHRGNNTQADILSELLDVKISTVHDGYNDSINVNHIVVFVKLHRDLGFSVGS